VVGEQPVCNQHAKKDRQIGEREEEQAAGAGVTLRGLEKAEGPPALASPSATGSRLTATKASVAASDHPATFAPDASRTGSIGKWTAE